MSIQRFAHNFFGADAFTKADGTLMVNASKFLLALWNRTGGGTGIIPQVSDPLTATGANVVTALGLTKDWNNVSDVPTGSGVQLPVMKPGNDCQVKNTGAHALKIYPASPDVQIDALGNGAAFSLAAGKLRIFECWTSNQLDSFGN